MTKRMSKTLAAEIAARTLAIVNPANRAMALTAALRRHGFDPAGQRMPDAADRAALVAWLLSVYAPAL